MTTAKLSEINSQECSAYPTAGIKELFNISWSLALSLLSGSLMGFGNRLFLSHYSLEALQGCTSATDLLRMFQISCISIASVVQLLIARYRGMNKLERIGNYVWQMIWWSLLSSLIIIPIGLTIEPFYFKGSSIAEEGIAYFRPLLFFNFLFPLATTLSSFYIGLGETKKVLQITVGAQLVNILFAPLLIFGIEGFLPPLGVLGSAIATIVAQAMSCLIFLLCFIQKTNREQYGTGEYQYNRTRFLEEMSIGVPVSISRMILYASIAGVTQLGLQMGGEYLLGISFGSTLFLLISFGSEGIGQGAISIASYLIGRKEWALVQKLIRSSLLLMLLYMLIFSIPLIIYPQVTISFFFPQQLTPRQFQLLQNTCYCTWIYCILFGFSRIGTSLLFAAKDTVFYFIFIATTSWLIPYGWMYYAIHVLHITPDLIWLAIGCSNIIWALVYLTRFQYRIRKEN